MANSTEVVVIGAGPGGYVAAIRAAQLNKKVTIVEKEFIGGVCLNVGCIPSKALITVGRHYDQAQHLDEFGLSASDVNVDYSKVQDYKEKTVKKLTGGVEMLLKGNKVNIIRGEAQFKDKNNLTIQTKEGTEELQFEDAIIATGSRPLELDSMKFGGRVIDSTGALALKDIPEKMVIVGGGVIGVEMAFIYANFGTKVTILEGLKDILPPNGGHITSVVKKTLKKKGVEVHTGAFVNEAKTDGDKAVVKATIKDEEQTFEADYALISIGRSPNTHNVGLDKAGVELDDRGLVKVDEQLRTNVSNLYAIGDIIPGPQLAHKASYEAKVAAEAISGLKTIVDYRTIPSVVFSEPEIAVTGISEKMAKEKGYNVKAKRFPFSANGRALAMNETDGFVNIIMDADTEKVLGGEIVGPEASDLINELTVAIEASLTAEDISLTIHPHPTLGEATMEAADAVLGNPIHIM